jgi:hypothetical protein
MKKFYSTHRPFCKILCFSLVMMLILEGLSWLAVSLDRSRNPILNHSTSCFFSEPKNTIDVLTIGTSDVYSSVAPMVWWKRYGYTGYTWGEPSQRIFETYAYLNKIYKTQSPKVVFLEVGDLYRDNTNVQVLDSIVRTFLGQLCPLVIYHRNFNPAKFVNLGASFHSVTKGYLLRGDTVPCIGKEDLAKRYKKPARINPLCANELERCVKLCESHGSQVVLLSIPDRSSWSMGRHAAIDRLAGRCGVPYLDLNTAMQRKIDWNRDSADGGMHMNYRGAAKVSAFLGDYLHTHCTLTDHRRDSAYALWNTDYREYAKAMRNPRLYKKSRMQKMMSA